MFNDTLVEMMICIAREFIGHVGMAEPFEEERVLRPGCRRRIKGCRDLVVLTVSSSAIFRITDSAVALCCRTGCTVRC